MTQPRAELYAALINTHIWEVVRRNFGQHNRNAFKFTDNQIVSYQISNANRPLKQWVRNRITKRFKRFKNPGQWRYMHTSNIAADLRTRQGATLGDINSSSQWIDGLSWINKKVEDFPMKTIRELSLSSDEVS